MSKIGSWLAKMVDWIVTGSGKIGGYFILIITLYTTWDVFSRYALGHGTDWSVEFTGYFMVLIIFFGLAYTERSGDHIIVDFVTVKLSKKTQRRLSLMGKVIFLAYSIMLGYFGWIETLTSLGYHSTSRTAVNVILWPFQLFIPIGLAITSLILIVEIARYFKKDTKNQRVTPEDAVIKSV